jgi:hypothetical protein
MTTLSKPASTTLIDALASLAANTLSDISTADSGDTDTWIGATIEIIATNGAASANPNLQIWIYGSQDGTNYSSQPIQYCDVVLEASATTRQEFPVITVPKRLKCKVKNLDAAVAATSITVKIQPQTMA